MDSQQTEKTQESLSKNQVSDQRVSTEGSKELLSEPEIENICTLDAKANVIDDEVLRYRIRQLIEKPTPLPAWQRILTHPLILLIVGFLLTGLVGGLLTNYYNQKQKDRDRERSFADELNRVRVGKIGEV